MESNDNGVRMTSGGDGRLAVMAQQGDLDAEETLMRKYKETVRKKARMYYMAGADEDDIVQEGMIGLLKAIRQFDPGKDASFGTFAGVCITRQIISAIRSAGRDKHKPLNTSVPLSNPVVNGSEDVTIADTLKTDRSENPEELMVFRDIAEYILHNGDHVFSDFEMQVINELLKCNDYERVSQKLNRNVKSVDNAVQRARKKIIKYLWG